MMRIQVGVAFVVVVFLLLLLQRQQSSFDGNTTSSRSNFEDSNNKNDDRTTRFSNRTNVSTNTLRRRRRRHRDLLDITTPTQLFGLEADATPKTTKSIGENVVDRSSADKSRKDLRFVMHVGPPKTGTTTLQIHTNQLVKKGYLETDNWYAGVAAQYHYEFLDGSVIDTTAPLMDYLQKKDADGFITAFEKDIATFRSTNTNVFVSTELYANLFHDSSNYQRLRKLIVEKYGYASFELVVGYRPYFEYIRSSWYQTVRVDIVDSIASLWRHNKRTGDLVLPQTVQDAARESSTAAQRFTNVIVERASDHVDAIHILDLHATDTPYIQTLICDILNATTACAVETERNKLNKKETSVNKSTNIRARADTIGIVAAQQGWIDINMYSRFDVMMGVMEYFDTNAISDSTDLPMDCSAEDDIYNELFTKTIAYDHQALPKKYDSTDNSNYEPNRIAVLTAQIQQRKAQKLYCTMVNTTEFFVRHPDFQSYIQKMFLT